MTPKRKNALNGKSPVMTYLVVLAAYAVLELCIKTGIMSSHLQGLLVPMVYYAIVAVGLNICVGILGELSLGHAGFMCIGAFGSAVFSLLTDGVLPDGLRFLLAFLIGVALATLFGFLIGIPVLRLNGDYLAIVTLAFGEIIKNLLNALYLGIDENGLHASLSNQMALGLSPDGKMLINGAMGVSGTPHDANFTISMVVLLIALFLAQNLVHSKHGRAIMAIRDNRIAAESIGINIVRYKMQAFTISAAIAGAVRANQAIQLPLFNRQMEVIHGPEPAEGDAQIVYLQKCHYAFSFLPCRPALIFAARFSRHVIAAGAQLKIITAIRTIE